MSRGKKGNRQKVPKKNTGPPSIPRWRSWYANKAPVFQFGLKFCGLILLFCILSPTPFYENAVSATVLVDARISHVLLNVIGEKTTLSGVTISSSKYAISVLEACSALDCIWFFCALVIAFPSRIALKIAGMAAGAIILFALNILRIASLFWVGSHFPRQFDITHQKLWSIILIVCVLALCCVWINWTRPNETPDPEPAEA